MNWMDVVTSTEAPDFEKAKCVLSKYYQSRDLLPMILTVSSPTEARIAASFAYLATMSKDVPPLFGSSFFDINVRRRMLLMHHHMKVNTKFVNKVQDKICEQLGKDISNVFKNSLQEILTCGLNFVDIFGAVVGIESLHEFVLNVGFFHLDKRYAILSDRPIIHSENRIVWRDSTGFYFLNDTVVPEWLVKIPADELSPVMLHKINNIAIRREFIKKIGIKRCWSVFTIIDKEGDYELGRILFGWQNRFYLRMLNLSTGDWHVEAVHPTCRTVQHALNWRRYGSIHKEWKPEILT